MNFLLWVKQQEISYNKTYNAVINKFSRSSWAYVSIIPLTFHQLSVWMASVWCSVAQ